MEYQKTAETTGNLIGNKIADPVAKLHKDRIMKFQKICKQNNFETVKNENDEKNTSRKLYNSRRNTKNY